MTGNELNEALAEHRLNLVQSIYDMLMTRASGRTVDEAEFANVRIRALRDSELAPLLPLWLREVRTPRDWSTFSGTRFNSSGQAREFLRREFAPVFGHLEGLDVQRDTSPIPGYYGNRPYRYPGTEDTEEPETYVPGNRVFLVHGHDQQPRNAVEAYLRRLGLEPIVLGDEPSRGRTIIEKLEA